MSDKKKILGVTMLSASVLYNGVNYATSIINKENRNEISNTATDFLNLNSFSIIDISKNNKNNYDLIRKCNELNVPIVLRIKTDAKTSVQIYRDVEFVKNIVEDYNINYPIFLDVNNIIENNKLSYMDKDVIVVNFLNRCSDYDINAGIYGTSRNLNSLLENDIYGVSLYDALVDKTDQDEEFIGMYNYYLKDGALFRNNESLILDSSKKLVKKNRI